MCFITALLYQKYQPQKEKTQNQDTSLLIQDFCQDHQFTQRETEIFILLLSHRTNQEIADQLFLSLGTVKTHVHNIFIKLDIKKRTQIIPLLRSIKKPLSQPFKKSWKYPFQVLSL